MSANPILIALASIATIAVACSHEQSFGPRAKDAQSPNASVASASAATTHLPQPITVQTDGYFTSLVMRNGVPVSGEVEGTWSATGLVTDGGTYTETWRFSGNTVHCREVLVGANGTIVMERRADINWIVVGSSGTFGGGNWLIEGGTEAYARLQGGGGGVGSHSADSYGDITANVVHQVHYGYAHFK